jgi:hypothetical protein
MDYQFNFNTDHGKAFLEPFRSNSQQKEVGQQKEIGLTYHNFVIAKILNILAKIGVGGGTVSIQDLNRKTKHVSIKDIKKLALADSIEAKHPEVIERLKNKEDILSMLRIVYERKKFANAEAEVKNGKDEALFSLGKMYLHGQGVPLSGKLAAEKFQEAAAKGIKKGEAFLELGKIYESGLDVPQSFQKAKDFYQQALNERLSQAKSFLDGVEKSEKRHLEAQDFIDAFWSAPAAGTATISIDNWEQVIECNNSSLKNSFINALNTSGLKQTPFSKIFILSRPAFLSDIFFEPNDGCFNNYDVNIQEKGKCLVIFAPEDKATEDRQKEKAWIEILYDTQPELKKFIDKQKPHGFLLNLDDRNDLMKKGELPKDLVSLLVNNTEN